jgi:AcrR family transcriptional regulator
LVACLTDQGSNLPYPEWAKPTLPIGFHSDGDETLNCILKHFLCFEIPVKSIDADFLTGYGLLMARQRLNLTDLRTAAIDVVDLWGFDGLSLSTVAEALGVGPSALYTHIEGLTGLRYLVAVAATENLTAEVRNAAIGAAGDSALTSMGHAYRGFARDHAGQFASTLLPPRSDIHDLARANRSLVDVFMLVYSAMGLSPERSHLAARSTRSAIHGFLALEHTAGTSCEHDAEYQHLLQTLRRGLAPEASG